MRKLQPEGGTFINVMLFFVLIDLAGVRYSLTYQLPVPQIISLAVMFKDWTTGNG